MPSLLRSGLVSCEVCFNIDVWYGWLALLLLGPVWLRRYWLSVCARNRPMSFGCVWIKRKANNISCCQVVCHRDGELIHAPLCNPPLFFRNAMPLSQVEVMGSIERNETINVVLCCLLLKALLSRIWVCLLFSECLYRSVKPGLTSPTQPAWMGHTLKCKICWLALARSCGNGGMNGTCTLRISCSSGTCQRESVPQHKRFPQLPFTFPSKRSVDRGWLLYLCAFVLWLIASRLSL